MSHLNPSSPRGPVVVSSVLLAIGLISVCASACRSADEYQQHADDAVAGTFSEDLYRSLDDRPETAARPELAPVETPTIEESEAEEVSEVEEPPAEPADVRVLTLAQALGISIRSGREYIDEKEALYLSALSLTGTRHGYSPLLATILNYTFADGNAIGNVHSTGATFGVSQIMPWGADFALDVSTGFTERQGEGGEFTTGASMRYTQPLLRGAGRAISHEPLIQAERNLMYAVRNFERFREAYAIQITQNYYDLVELKQSVGNSQRSLEQLRFGRRQAEAKYNMGEIREVEVLRARRSELSAENDLLQAQETLSLGLDEFRVVLGLPDSAEIDVVPVEPEFIAVEFDVESAIEVALTNRLDYLNRKEQIEDSQRNLAIVRDGLRPSLDFDASYGLVGIGGSAFLRQNLNTHTWAAGLLYEIPVDRVDERNAYRTAQIGHAQTLRNFDEFGDSLVVGLTNRFRTLRRIELSLEIQRESIHDEERNLVIAQLLFERGENSNRDVVEAQESLLTAQNALVSERVSYEIERLNLLRDMGILFIDENGMWVE